MARGLLVAVALLAAAPVEPSCPSADRSLERLSTLALRQASRTARFGTPPPTGLYQRAVKRVGQPITTQQGKQGIGVIVVELPVERLWKALNDENHHALDRYVPVRHSEVIDGSPRGESRLLVQAFQRWGIGRWWAVRIQMNGELYARSDGALWELSWKDSMNGVAASQLPEAVTDSNLPPVRSSHGAWLLIPLAADCTLVEYFNQSDPGGFVGAIQSLTGGRALRATLRGIIRLAEEHIPSAHPEGGFLRPDGAPLAGTNEELR